MLRLFRNNRRPFEAQAPDVDNWKFDELHCLLKTYTR